ncbi:hypothetical protein ACCO45_000374 [Purpureocillium lilacinum]|uniref:Uncharacterized protein n=1 Tax=Purpureocillium lilacinum TaxID=33203 RepID=A0ACC4E408_PURLI
MGSGNGRPRAAASPASAVAAKAAKARDGWGARCRRPLHSTTILSGQRDSQSWMETFFPSTAADQTGPGTETSGLDADGQRGGGTVWVGAAPDMSASIQGTGPRASRAVEAAPAQQRRTGEARQLTLL